ncbi:MAG TPA: universal stress protein [Solirubrobacteraceae bacterium]
MAGPIVCGVDDSTAARDAAVAASALSARASLPLLFVHVAPDYGRRAHPDTERKRQLGGSVANGIELLDRVTGDVARGRGAIRRVPLGDPASQLVTVAESVDAEMVVIGSRGRGPLTAVLLGSVSRELLARSRRPVLVVQPGAQLPMLQERGPVTRPPSVLCGVDGSPESIHAARAASRLASLLNDRLVLAHVYRPLRTWTDYGLARRYASGALLSQWKAGLGLLEEAAEPLGRLPGPEAELSLEPGDPETALLGIAEREDAEVLVLGSHGQGTLQAALDGSVASSLAAGGPIPVLIVPSVSEANTVSTPDRAHASLAKAA